MPALAILFICIAILSFFILRAIFLLLTPIISHYIFKQFNDILKDMEKEIEEKEKKDNDY